MKGKMGAGGLCVGLRCGPDVYEHGEEPHRIPGSQHTADDYTKMSPTFQVLTQSSVKNVSFFVSKALSPTGCRGPRRWTPAKKER